MGFSTLKKPDQNKTANKKPQDKQPKADETVKVPDIPAEWTQLPKDLASLAKAKDPVEKREELKKLNSEVLKAQKAVEAAAKNPEQLEQLSQAVKAAQGARTARDQVAKEINAYDDMMRKTDSRAALIAVRKRAKETLKAIALYIEELDKTVQLFKEEDAYEAKKAKEDAKAAAKEAAKAAKEAAKASGPKPKTGQASKTKSASGSATTRSKKPVAPKKTTKPKTEAEAPKAEEEAPKAEAPKAEAQTDAPKTEAPKEVD